MSPVLSAEPLAPSTPVPAHAPLSFPQRQMWLIESMEPTGGLYNEITQLRVDGDLDPDTLLRCLNELVARHDALRSTVQVIDGVATCVPLPRIDLSFGEPVDLSTLADADRERVLAELATGFGTEPYDLARGPLIRCALVRLGSRSHVLLIGTHHLIVDGASIDLLLDELDELYTGFARGGPVQLPPLTTSYADFARWQLASRTDERWAEDLNFWKSELDGAPGLLDLTSGRLRPAIKNVTGRRIAVRLRPGLRTAALDLARASGSTQHSVLTAAFASVLHRHTDQRDLVIGTEAAGRPEEEFEPVVGYFANLVPLRLRPSPEQTFAEFADHTTDVLLTALEHQHLPFPQLVELINPERDLSYGPLTQVVFTQAKYRDAPHSIGPLTARQEQVDRSRSRFDLLIETQDLGDTVQLWVEFDTELFTEQWVRSLCQHFENLLVAVLREPELRLADVPMLRPEERERAIATAPPIGAPSPAMDVVLLAGNRLAPTGAVGVVHQLPPTLCTLRDDQVVGTVVPTTELGYWSPDGALVRLGRPDRLPRVHGGWAPLEAVRAAIAVHPRVRSVGVAFEDGRIVARVTPSGTESLSVSRLRDHLATRLPRYAIPAAFVLSAGQAVQADVPVEDGLLDTVLTVLRDALEQPDLRPDDDFFEVGGHSMIAAQAAATLREEHGLTVSLRWLFEYPTPRELAEVIAEHRSTPAKSTSDRAVPAKPTQTPLTVAQADIWIVNLLAGKAPVNNIPIAVTIDGPLDVDALREAFRAVVTTHEVLRSGFGLRQGQLAQWPLDELPELRVSSLECLPVEHRLRESERLRASEAARPFRLGPEAPMRALLLVSGPEQAELLITVHHIAADGIGMAVLCSDLSAHYARLVGAANSEPNPPALSWSEYASWEDNWLGAERGALTEFWQTQLRGLPAFTLPTELPRPQRLSFAGDTVTHRLPDDVATGIAALASTHRASPFMVCASALAVLLHGITGSTDLPIATPTENRHLPQSRELVGCTISMVILRTDTSADPTFAELLDRMRGVTLDALQHQGLPSSALAKIADEHHQGGRSGLTPVSFDWQERTDLGWSFAGCTTEWGYGSTHSARNDLVLMASRDARGGIELVAEYNTALWSENGARSWVAGLARVLAEAVTDPHRRLSAFSAVTDPG